VGAALICAPSENAGAAGTYKVPDHVTVLDPALRDAAGATHGLVDDCREARLRLSVGYELTERVRAAILDFPASALANVALLRQAAAKDVSPMMDTRSTTACFSRAAVKSASLKKDRCLRS
jgi:hypothetical protein